VTLSGSAARTVTWDAAGNMISDGVLTYVHDAENRLTQVTRATPSLNATYTYDPLGRRVQRNVNGTSTFTLHDGDEEIAEYDATGALIRRFIPGPGTDEPIAIVVPASGGGAPERRYFHEDRIGNVIAMSGLASGGSAPALAEGPFTYDAYGRSPQPLGTSATSTPFRYTGRRLDAETGNYYYRARFYTPTLGQFIETDPVGYADNLNMYAYVGGDPVNATDPSGMCTGSRITNKDGTCAISDGWTTTGGPAPKGIPYPQFIPEGKGAPGVPQWNSRPRVDEVGPDSGDTAASGTWDYVTENMPDGDPLKPQMDELQDLATEAASEAPNLPQPLRGIVVHRLFQLKVIARGYAAEVSYKDGQLVSMGTPGSVRADVIIGPISAPWAVVDLKTGLALFTPSRAREMSRHIPRSPFVRVRYFGILVP